MYHCSFGGCFLLDILHILGEKQLAHISFLLQENINNIILFKKEIQKNL